MSHRPAFALIPGDTPANEIEEKLWDLTSKYAEHYSIEWIEPCECVGSKAHEDVYKETYLKAIEELDAHKKKNKCDSPSENSSKYSDEDLTYVFKRVNEILGLHSLSLTPDPECAYCKGTGAVIEGVENYSCYRAIYIGGMYSGLIYGPDSDYESLQNKDLYKGFDDETIIENCRPVSDVPIEDPFYFANIIFTPDGKMESFSSGYSSDKPEEEEKWKQHIVEIFKKYSDHLVISLDCRG